MQIVQPRVMRFRARLQILVLAHVPVGEQRFALANRLPPSSEGMLRRDMRQAVFSRCRAERLVIFADDSGAGAPGSALSILVPKNRP